MLLILLSTCSLLTYRNGIEFCALTVPPEISLKSLMSSERFLFLFSFFSIFVFDSFFFRFLGIFMQAIMSSSNRDNLISFCLTCMLFVSISCLTAVARITSLMLNQSSQCVSLLGSQSQRQNLSLSNMMLGDVFSVDHRYQGSFFCCFLLRILFFIIYF